jgi:putative GTP pyrophosphokinase
MYPGMENRLIMHNLKLPDQKVLRKIYEEYFTVRTLILRDLENAIEVMVNPLSSRPTVKGRVKDFKSYYKKYLKLLRKDAPNPKLLLITDLIGIRVICPFSEDVALVQNLIAEKFEVTEVEQKGSNYSFKEFGYQSLHLLIKIPESIIKHRGDCGLEVAEIQIRTILQDAWAEVEHELVYKAEFTPFDASMRRKLAALNASLSLADTIFQEVRTYQRQLNRELEKRRDSFFKKIEESTDDLLFSDTKTKVPDSECMPNPLDIAWMPVTDSIDELLLNALSAHNLGQFQEAINLYTYILGLHLEDAITSLIYKHRGMANFAQSQYEEAIFDFTKSLELDCNSYKAAYFRGLVKSVLQQYAEAIDDFTLSITINPYQSFCLYRRGQAYYHVEDFPQALADCEAALVLEPDSESIHKFKNLLLTKLKM